MSIDDLQEVSGARVGPGTRIKILEPGLVIVDGVVSDVDDMYLWVTDKDGSEQEFVLSSGFYGAAGDLNGIVDLAREGKIEIVAWNDGANRAREAQIASTAYSPKTSRKQVPRIFSLVSKKYGWEPGTMNADIGGGRFEDATKFLADKGVENIVWDPGNRSETWNQAALDRFQGHQADTVTVANVLNVVPDAAVRDQIVGMAADAVKHGGTAYFGVYEGDKTGVGRETRDGWQANRVLRSYVVEIDPYFEELKVGGDLIAARGPKI